MVKDKAKSVNDHSRSSIIQKIAKDHSLVETFSVYLERNRNISTGRRAIYQLRKYENENFADNQTPN